MTTVPVPADPSAALEAACRDILAGPMRDVPILNRCVPVAAIGFRRYGAAWFGALLAPWALNLVLVPDEPSAQPAGAADDIELPCGVLGFLHARYGDLPVLACSLLSPLPAEHDAVSAVDFAASALAEVLSAPPAPARRPMSRRELLFGRRSDAGA